jgi:hypothetical protein
MHGHETLRSRGCYGARLGCLLHDVLSGSSRPASSVAISSVMARKDSEAAIGANQESHKAPGLSGENLRFLGAAREPAGAGFCSAAGPGTGPV